MVRRKNQCAYGFGFKFQRDSTSVCEGAPKVFRQRNSQRLNMEISKAEITSAVAATTSPKSQATTGKAPAATPKDQELRGAEILIKALQA